MKFLLLLSLVSFADLPPGSKPSLSKPPAAKPSQTRTIVAKIPAKIPLEARCTKSSECTWIEEGCCGCNAGGKLIPINQKHARKHAEALRPKCAEMMCPTVMSGDASCDRPALACVSGRCVAKKTAKL